MANPMWPLLRNPTNTFKLPFIHVSPSGTRKVIHNYVTGASRQMLRPACQSGVCGNRYGFRAIIQYLIRFAYAVRWERQRVCEWWPRALFICLWKLSRTGRLPKKKADCLTDVKLFFFMWGTSSHHQPVSLCSRVKSTCLSIITVGRMLVLHSRW